MASWGFGNMAAAGSGSGSAAQPGPELQELETEELALQQAEIVAGDRLKLFPEPWPADRLPPPTASLLSIASNKGILAAAGPNSLVIASTEKVRSEYIRRRKTKEDGSGDEPQIKLLEPEATLSVPRVSHVAFSADESCLVIAAEEGGGLAVYDTSAVADGSQEPAFQLSTNGTAVRHLLPNPNSAADLAPFFGIVLSNGQLLLADLKERKLVQTTGGTPVFCEQVCSAAWSKLGKQIIAGLEDGTATQIDRAGVVKDRIPQPPQLEQIRQNQYETAKALPVTSISWLSTHEFLTVYSPINPPPGEDMPPTDDSTYFLVKREQNRGFTFRKFAADPCTAFMQNRTPANHFMQRLNEWSPNLNDLLVVASSASIDVGLFAHFKSPDEFATAVIKDEGRRAAVPMSYVDQVTDTSPIGMAIDLSVKELAPRPIPAESDVLEESPTPLPALCLLNNEGVFSMWWVIYRESIRAKSPYPGMTNKTGPYRPYTYYHRDQPTPTNQTNTLGSTPPSNNYPPQTPSAYVSPEPQTVTSVSSPFTSMGSASQSQQPAFGKPSFGAPSIPSFGGASSIGQSSSPWGGSKAAAPASNAATFGKPSFGTTTSMTSGSAFGQVGGMGMNRSSPWAASNAGQSSPGQAQTGGSVFGSADTKSPFATFGSSSNVGSPFAAFGKKENQASSFAAAGQQNPPSPFAAAGKQNPALTKETSVGSTATLGSTGSSFSFGQASTFQGSTFGVRSANETSSFETKPALSNEETMEDDSSANQNSAGGGLLGLGSSGFKLGSTFKGDGTAKDDLPKPKTSAMGGLFGNAFGDVLDSTKDKKPESPPVTIKKEPDTEDQPSLEDIPVAKPLPPPTTTTEETKKNEVVPEPAPLPPSWQPSKSAGIPEDAPLPPFPPSTKTKDEAHPDEALAGSPPVDLGSEKFSQIPESDDGDAEESPEEEGYEDEENDDAEEGSEGDYETEEESDEDAEDVTYEVQNPDALKAFQSRLQPPQPKHPEPPEEPPTPPSADRTSHTPAGLPPGLSQGPVFAPPSQEELRSPSPSRGGQRAVTSPVGKSSIATPARPLPSQIKAMAVPPAPPAQRSVARRKPPGPDAGSLEDESYSNVKEILSAPLEPSKSLPIFFAHQDYTGNVEKSGIGGQIEKVYRDINSMMDVLSLNVRSLASFVEGHVQLRKQATRGRQDLEDSEGWCLDENADLSAIIDEVGQQLEDGKLENVKDTLQHLKEEESEAMLLRSKTAELRKQIAMRNDGEHLAVQEAAPLDAETELQQNELREAVQTVRKLLADVEEKLSLLRADLVSLSAANSSVNKAQNNVPTVEAVTSTILKMTSMVEQRSGDIDVLEAQIRRLPNGIASLRMSAGYEDDLAAHFSGKMLMKSTGSPATASPRRLRMAANGDPLGMSGMFGNSKYTTPPPGGLRRSRVMFSPEASAALARSTGSWTGSARKKMNDITELEARAFTAKVERRRDVLRTLKQRVEIKGTKIVRAD